MARMSHTEARALFAAGFKSVIGRDGTVTELQAVQGVGYLETSYAAGWKGAGKGSWNFGAIQSSRPPCDPATSFLYTDTNPNPDGTSTPYSICFRKYPNAEAGAADLVRVMYVKRPSVLVAAGTGDLYKVSEALYLTHYYAGFGPTKEARIRNHLKALTYAVAAQARELEEAGPPLPPRTLREGLVGEDVMVVQRIVGTKPDGIWGQKTTAAVKIWQAANKLASDGVWGAKSRAKAKELGLLP